MLHVSLGVGRWVKVAEETLVGEDKVNLLVKFKCGEKYNFNSWLAN